ncbi:hypothetical protein RHGRI_028249 [Rhododendron griersonianum]|uniref:Ankyrin repeat protein n=1 Tax=Rhododendron griersonianum TaxID=479676 RepID=A0AAV6IF79_9ERIC|nr:hypothetical protein RHGRI_028249 [Rhododendron griersonianum]
MDLNLINAAEARNIDALYESIGSDPYILDKVDTIPFVNTPLHVAASTGQTRLAVEIMNLKPSLSTKLNPNGLSPLHLALLNGHFETVKGLVELDKDLVRVKGREKLTPLCSRPNIRAHAGTDRARSVSGVRPALGLVGVHPSTTPLGTGSAEDKSMLGPSTSAVFGEVPSPRSLSRRTHISLGRHVLSHLRSTAGCRRRLAAEPRTLCAHGCASSALKTVTRSIP